MKLRKRLQNPFALVGQGFVLGGVLYFATHAESLLASPAPAQPSASLVETVAPGLDAKAPLFRRRKDLTNLFVPLAPDNLNVR